MDLKRRKGKEKDIELENKSETRLKGMKGGGRKRSKEKIIKGELERRKCGENDRGKNRNSYGREKAQMDEGGRQRD